MDKKKQVPRYMRIAADVAKRIYKGFICQGEVLKGRSVLASEYKVSPETIRRAMRLLEEQGVVKVVKGMGIIVSSSENAYKFVKDIKKKENINELKTNMKKLIKEKSNIEQQIYNANETILDYYYRFNYEDVIEPIEIKVPVNSKIVGKTIKETQFWQNTGGTIVGIKRGKETILSPGPNIQIKGNDKIYIVGNSKVMDRVKELM